ncbi:MAG: ABC-F family ATP-binding cassette domain-containing protein [Bacteroides sp.]|nr:ABC-F family ATP-binding cassette domain-containing protein [Bacteroides sp.]
MISINSLSVSFSGKTLFDNVSFIIKDKDRIGLTGKNGAGKSTLLKILSRHQASDTGSIVLTSGHEVGYLPQEMIPDSTKTVMDETLTAFDKTNELEREIENLNTQLAERTDYESAEYHKLIERLSEANERFHLIGGSDRMGMAEKVLMGLGFKRSDFTHSITEFSSGWQMRVELAKILLRNPDVMLLDEPTNHLDIESISWLEDFLQGYRGAVVLVSHDRKFLDKVTTRTIEIVLGKIEDYNVPYSQYVEQRAERRQIQQNAYDNQQKEIENIERFIERFRYKATKARQAQSRLKMLDKMERVEVDQTDNTAISFRFPPAPHCGKIVLRAQDAGKRYGEKQIFSHFDFVLEKGEKVALVGRNGEGKSTFSKMVVGDITEHDGTVELGAGVKIGYFAQNQAALLDGNKTVFETIDDIAVGEVRTRIRNILGCFLFSGEDIEKKVKVLSGGEKGRLALAKLLLEPVNLLVLDEPTNHLDMRSKDILKMALLQYDGSLIVVSHDRDFLEGLTTKTYEFRDGKVKPHIGDVSVFLSDRKMERLQELEKSAGKSGGKPVEKAKAQAAVPTPKIDAAAERERKKQREREQRKIATAIEKLEAEITALEAELAEMDRLFIADAAQCTVENCNKYEEKKRLAAAKTDEWAELQERMSSHTI